MKKFFLMLVVSMFLFTVSGVAQMVTKTVTTSKTAAVNLNFTTDKSQKVFGLQIVLDSANMHANDTIVTSFLVSNDGVRFVAYPSLSGGTLKKTVPAGVYTSTLNWKYFRVVLTPSSNDSTFTATGLLLKN
jgi:hypothetical protein